MARLARLICVSFGVAVAIWLLPASIHIVSWSADSPARVALLPPLWKLWLTLPFAVAAAFVIPASVLAPLGLLWLWAVPFLPWLPDRAPALLALAGPLRWAVLALALAASAIALRSGRGFTGWLPGRRAIFVTSLALYLVFGLWSAEAVGPGADEPHYLVITQSLLRDHDLAIENNHARGDYHEYFGGELKPDFLHRGLNDVIYSIHAPGLPALLVPAYAIAGYRGAVAMLCLFGALAAVAIFDLALLIAGPSAALAAWAAVCLTVPFVPHSWLIFPEMPGAMLMAWAVLWLYAPLPANARTWVWRGAALAALPWLHTKFVVLFAAMLGALALRLWRNPKAIAALILPAIVSVGLWELSFYVLYGSLDPQIPYGDFPKLFVLISNIPRGILGLLFDQKFGLLPYAPVYLAAIAGAWMMLRRDDLRLFALATIGTVIAFVASSTRMYMWWGGSSAPARFLVPILPLLAPMIAVVFQKARPVTRAAFVALLAVSLTIAAVGVWAPERFLLFSAPHGVSNLIEALQGPAPLSYLLPIFTEDVVREPLARLAPWLIAGATATLVIALMSRRARPQMPFTAALSALVIVAIAGAVLAGAPLSREQRDAAVLRGRLDLLRAVDSSLRGLDYARRVRLNARQVIDLGAFSVSRAAGQLASGTRIAGPFNLPAGQFTARVLFAGAKPQTGETTIMLGDGPTLAHASAGSTVPMTFTLPMDASVWVAVSDAALAASAQQVDITPDAVVPRGVRPDVAVHAIEAIDGRPGAFVVYGDGQSYPEGGVFWTRGTHAATVFVAPNGAQALTFTLHVGPVAGAVRLTVAGQDRSVTLSHDQTQLIDVPVPAGARLVPVIVEASGEFRPSEHEPGSSDRRWLGVQVRIGLR